MPGVRLSCLLLKAHPSPDESRRGEATTQHPAGKHPTLLGVQGAGVAAAPALGGTASGAHVCIPGSPALRQFQPLWAQGCDVWAVWLVSCK